MHQLHIHAKSLEMHLEGRYRYLQIGDLRGFQEILQSHLRSISFSCNLILHPYDIAKLTQRLSD